MHLTSVDLPAPLSPTSAVTSPGRMARSTSWSTCTGPKLLFIALSSRIGFVTGPPYRHFSLTHHSGWPGHPEYPREPRPSSVPVLLDPELVARRLGLAHADVRGLHAALVHDLLDLVLGDQDRGEQQRLD